nr:signal peptidase I [Clostridia bacterium]
MKFLSKLWNLITTLLVVVMVFLAAALVGVRLVGLTPYAVLSGSMEPTYHVGSLIYVKAVDHTTVEVGDPITFIVNDDLLLATHRVVDKKIITEREEAVLDEAGQPVLDENGDPVTQIVQLEEPVYYFQTKGDANEDVDGSAVHYKNIVGKPVFSIPLLGYLSSFLQTRKGMIMGISVALVLIILTFLPNLLNWVDDEPKKKGKSETAPEANPEQTPSASERNT